jgi:aromatic amino acid aminotransferase I / 2-aminoadipate transaminase
VFCSYSAINDLFDQGLPAPDYFPFAALHADMLLKVGWQALPLAHTYFGLIDLRFQDSFPLDASRKAQSSWFWRIFGSGSGAREEKSTRITIPKWPAADADPSAPILASTLQYGQASGLPTLQKFLRDFSEQVYAPAYDDFVVLADTGNTDGWTRAALTLMNSGDAFLTEEWSYPSAMASVQPYGIGTVAVPMDEYGMRADALREILATWDPAQRGGMKRPRVIYTVTVGQNPTGAVGRLNVGDDEHAVADAEHHFLCWQNMIGSRKKEIYDICVEFGEQDFCSLLCSCFRLIALADGGKLDIIIVEDEPYFFQVRSQATLKCPSPPSWPST